METDRWACLAGGGASVVVVNRDLPPGFGYSRTSPQGLWRLPVSLVVHADGKQLPFGLAMPLSWLGPIAEVLSWLCHSSRWQKKQRTNVRTLATHVHTVWCKDISHGQGWGSCGWSTATSGRHGACAWMSDDWGFRDEWRRSEGRWWVADVAKATAKAWCLWEWPRRLKLGTTDNHGRGRLCRGGCAHEWPRDLRYDELGWCSDMLQRPEARTLPWWMETCCWVIGWWLLLWVEREKWR